MTRYYAHTHTHAYTHTHSVPPVTQSYKISAYPDIHMNSYIYPPPYEDCFYCFSYCCNALVLLWTLKVQPFSFTEVVEFADCRHIFYFSQKKRHVKIKKQLAQIIKTNSPAYIYRQIYVPLRVTVAQNYATLSTRGT